MGAIRLGLNFVVLLIKERYTHANINNFLRKSTE